MPRAVLFLVVAAILPAAALTGRDRPAGRDASQAQNTYAVLTSDGRRTLPFRASGGADMVPLDQLAELFNFTTAEDAVVGGITMTVRGQRIIAIPGQSFVQVAGRVVSLPAPVQRDRGGWQVPVEFLSSALGPAMGVRMEVRRASHLVLVGDVRLPQVTARVERTASGGRIIIDVQPATPHRVTREGNRLVVRFEAAALDPRPMTSLLAEFVTGARVEGTSLVFDLGPSAATVQPDPDRDGTRIAIDLLAPGAPAEPSRQEPPVQEPPALDVPVPGAVRTVVIDPGHGGEDEGAHGHGGAKEKDLTLEIAVRLKAAIESRMGLRVLLTRDSDQNVAVDQRTAVANNSKADLLLSLHANASVRPSVRGAQVLSLAIENYQARADAARGRGAPVPVLGGSTRIIEAVPWDLAQLPFAGRSAALASILIRRLSERGVPLHAKPAAQLPLRVLVGANMPAVILEMGFLTNADDEKALRDRQMQGAIIDALLATIGEVRRGVPDVNHETSPR